MTHITYICIVTYDKKPKKKKNQVYNILYILQELKFTITRE